MDAFVIGPVVSFEVMDAETPPTITTEDNEGFVIAFVRGAGFQWAKYHNGSDTWVSRVTYQEIRPIVWLKKLPPG